MNEEKIQYKELKAEIYNFQAWFFTDNIKELKGILDQALSTSGYTVLKFIDYNFPVKGYTALWLLAESHLALHYFEEEQKAYVELSGCNSEMNIAFQDFLKTKEIKFKQV